MSTANSKLLIEMERKNSTTENFRFGFGRFLDLVSFEYRFKYINEIGKEDLNWCDAYIAVRPNTPMSYSIAKVIKESGRSYIVYFDDDLINREGSIRKRNTSSRKCLEISDAMFGANPALCNDYGRFTKSHFCINTAIDESELSYSERGSLPIRFVYAAGRDHAAIFEAIINPILKRLLDEYCDIVHFTFIGVEPKIKEIGYSENFSFIPLMPLDKYTEYMRTHVFDVGMAPLEDNRFSRMKYFNKYIEYGKSAIVGVYSDIEPYTFAVRDGENGLMVKNTEEDWYQALRYCIENIEYVRKMGLNAQNDLRINFAIEGLAAELKKKLDEVIKTGKYEKILWRKNSVQEKIFYFEDKFGKFVNQIRKRGLKETLKLIRQRLS